VEGETGIHRAMHRKKSRITRRISRPFFIALSQSAGSVQAKGPFSCVRPP